MKYAYFDASAGVSGDMILGALLDLGVSPVAFQQKAAELHLPVEIDIKEVKRATLRSLKVNVKVKNRRTSRKWADVEDLLKKSSFSHEIQTRAMEIFKRLFEAEAKVHGRKFHETHLHEAGADDAIIDIMGSCWLAEKLDIKQFYSSPLNIGGGWVKTAHGTLPVPPPAVAELLKGIPVYSKHVTEELVTPTGAAILASLVDKFVPFPELCYEHIGCGAGSRNFSGYPNILRVFYGNAGDFKTGRDIYLIETNIDDENPQILGQFLDKALKMGALDAFLTPVGMKKNRLGTKLTLLTELDKMEALIEAVFCETSSIGLRYFPVHRRVLRRKIQKVRVLAEEIPVKVAYLRGKAVNIQPEFSACRRIAKKHSRPVKDVLQQVMQEFDKQKGTEKTTDITGNE